MFIAHATGRTPPAPVNSAPEIELADDCKMLLKGLDQPQGCFISRCERISEQPLTRETKHLPRRHADVLHEDPLRRARRI